MADKTFIQGRNDRITDAYTEDGTEVFGYSTTGNKDYGMQLSEVRQFILDLLDNTSSPSGASRIGVQDIGGYFTGSDVESILQELGAGGGGGVTDHGNLTGLADDDHTQYHNDTRGDARYFTQTLLGSTANGEGADLIGIETAGSFSGTIQDVINALVSVTDINNNGSQYIGFNDTTVDKFDSTNVGDAILELTDTGTGNGASIIGIEDADSLLTSTNVEGALNELAKGTLPAPAYTQDTIVLNYTSVSGGASILPTNGGSIRVHALADCLIKFGTESILVGELNSIYMAAGTEVFGVPSGATHLAVRGVGTPGILNISGLSGLYKHTYTTNAVCPALAGSSRIELPEGRRIRVFSLTDCYINFGDLTVSADETSLFFEAGTEILNVPSGVTHIAAQRYTLDGGIYVSGIS